MKTDTLKLGDKVVIGPQKKVRRGLDGTVCLVVARGKFRAAHGPCGEYIVPFPNAHDTRVVVAEPVMEYVRDADGRVLRDASGDLRREQVWRPRLKHHSSIYPFAEWKAARGEREREKREYDRWAAAFNAMDEELKKARERLAKALDTPVWAESRYDQTKPHGSRYVDCTAIDLDLAMELLISEGDAARLRRRSARSAFREYERARTTFAEWKATNPNPRECRRPL